MRNMKIEINEQQPLDEVVAELERLGFERTYYTQNTSGKWVKTCDVRKCEPTTLAELKEQLNAAD